MNDDFRRIIGSLAVFDFGQHGTILLFPSSTSHEPCQEFSSSSLELCIILDTFVDDDGGMCLVFVPTLGTVAWVVSWVLFTYDTCES